MSDATVIKIGNIPVGGNNPLTFILGPCQLESRDHAMFMAEKIIQVCEPSSSNFILNPVLIKQIDLRLDQLGVLELKKV